MIHPFADMIEEMNKLIIVYRNYPTKKRSMEIRVLADKICKAKVEFKKHMMNLDKIP